ncbi:MAG TPA: dipeptidase [Gemmatimonadales bacterium]|nr:dipeptidase [Gemmatimonadales bacterium]
MNAGSESGRWWASFGHGRSLSVSPAADGAGVTGTGWRSTSCLLALTVTSFLLCSFGPPAPLLAQDRYLEQARQLMREVPLIDGHNDLPWAVRTGFALSLDSADIARPQPRLMTDIPRLKQGLVGGQFWSAYSPSSFEGRGAARVGWEQVDFVHRLVARYPETFAMAGTADDVVRIHRAGKIASLIGLEGGHMIENSLGVLREFYARGVRYLTLTHSRNVDWADASTDSLRHGGLTRFGEEVIREMNRLGMLVDLSHVSDSTMWDVLRVTEAPVIFSHSSSRRFTPHRRNVPDDVLRAVARNGGVVMVNYVSSFIHLPAYEHGQRGQAYERGLRQRGLDGNALRDSMEAWNRANPEPRPSLSVVADHMDHIRAVAGADHVGIGSDLDGIDTTPIGLEDVSTFPALIAELLRRGWSAEDAKKAIGLNVLRVMRANEAVAARLQRTRGPSVAQIEVLDGWSTKPPWDGPSR